MHIHTHTHKPTNPCRSPPLIAVDTDLSEEFLASANMPLSDILHLVRNYKRSEVERIQEYAANTAAKTERMKKINHAEMQAAKQRKEAIERKREQREQQNKGVKKKSFFS